MNFILKSGTAFKSSRRAPRDPEIVSVDACPEARFVGTAWIDGAECAAFRCGRNYYFQSIHYCRAPATLAS